MAKSIRISDELYELALSEAALASRSLAQQVEHWSRIGAALDQQQSAEIRAAAARFSMARNEALVRAGELAPEALYAIPARLAREARVQFPADAFEGKGDGW